MAIRQRAFVLAAGLLLVAEGGCGRVGFDAVDAGAVADGGPDSNTDAGSSDASADSAADATIDATIDAGGCITGDCFPAGACGVPGGLRDTTFGTDGTGTVTLEFSADEEESAWALAQQPDGQILVAGSTNIGTRQAMAVARIDPDGALDATFGTDGQTVVQVNYDYVYSIAVQDDGKVVIGGDTWNGGRQDDFMVIRLDADGDLDRGFGTGGHSLVDFGGSHDTGKTVSVTSSGELVIVGTASYDDPNADFAVAQFDTTGILDASFGVDGQSRTDFGGGADGVALGPHAMRFDSLGRIVVTGVATMGDEWDFALARYTADGILDPAFSGDGRVITDLGGRDAARTLLVLADDRILVGGHTAVDATADASEALALARYLPDGSLDATFGAGGLAVHEVSGGEVRIHSLLEVAGGQLIAVGYVGPVGARDLLVARFCADGALDTTFGTNGLLIDDLNGGDDAAFDLVGQAGNQIVVLAQSEIAGLTRFVLTRYDL